MWPFKEKLDLRKPTAAATAIAASLEREPDRWKLGENRCDRLVHDSGIEIDTSECWIVRPWVTDEPNANTQVIEHAVNQWIALRLKSTPPGSAS